MSIQTIEESPWLDSGPRVVVRRAAKLVAVAAVLAGPFLLGGALGWVLSREAGPTLAEDGWLRARQNVTAASVDARMAATAELAAAGIDTSDLGGRLQR